MKYVNYLVTFIGRLFDGIGALVSNAGAPEVGAWFNPVVQFVGYIFNVADRPNV